MKEGILYKYLDVNGGRLMLENSNLQYTNATKFNDPFDCHPSLINFSNVPPEMCKAWEPEVIQAVRSDSYRRLRDNAWVCSLSKVYDSMLMWSYYTYHTGVCIGLNLEKVSKHLHCGLGQMVYTEGVEVEYRDIIQKPDFFKDGKDFWHYQLCTKGKSWEHEQEVRLIIIEPMQFCMDWGTPYKPKNKKDPIPWNEVRFYLRLRGECFESVYLGIKIDEDDKNAIIIAARKLNPDIKIYQMQPDPLAFRLIPKEI
jgi:hypothetical protein